jgi:hypothetical protein
MPQDFVKRWGELSALEERLAGVEERLAPMAEWYSGAGEPESSGKPEPLTIKNSEDYFAFVKGGQQRRTRNHERLIGQAVEQLKARAAKVSTPHPIDLRLTEPAAVIIEAKIVGRFSPVLAVRAAVGQLLEYRRFIGPRESDLCILLDADPGKALVEYVEDGLGMLVIWLTSDGFFAGPKSAARLPSLGLALP